MLLLIGGLKINGVKDDLSTWNGKSPMVDSKDHNI